VRALQRETFRAVQVMRSADKPLIGVRERHAGGDHACAVLDDGSLYCWGRNDLGQLGDGSGEAKRLPERVGLCR
jgi:alpha-tubulin suppressor-like RCC1 family protein